MDEKELKRANKDIKTLLKVCVDIASFEDKTNDMLREIISKSDGLGDEERDRMAYACDCMDEMLDYAEEVIKLVKDYISPFGTPYDNLFDMSYNDFNILYSQIIRIYNKYREAYDEAYNQYSYVGKYGYYKSVRYQRSVL